MADVFNRSGATRGCWSTIFLLKRQDHCPGRGAGNEAAFTEFRSRAASGAGSGPDVTGSRLGVVAARARSPYATAGGSELLGPEDRDPAHDDDVWLGHVLLRAGLSSPDRRHSGVADGCGRARQGTRCQGGRGLSLATGPKRRANGFLGTERVFAGCGFTKVARHTVRGVVMLAGPTALTPTTVASLRPLGRATTGRFCRSRALIVRCSAVGRTKTKRPPITRWRQVAANLGCRNYPRLRAPLCTRATWPRACTNDASAAVI